MSRSAVNFRRLVLRKLLPGLVGIIGALAGIVTMSIASFKCDYMMVGGCSQGACWDTFKLPEGCVDLFGFTFDPWLFPVGIVLLLAGLELVRRVST